MKAVLGLSSAICVWLISPAFAQTTHSVRGYTRSDGTYVAPHRATNPNDTRADNWSTKGNVNPDTGKDGTVDPYSNPARSTDTGYQAYRPKKPY
jgi:hypothetical protein